MLPLSCFGEYLAVPSNLGRNVIKTLGHAKNRHRAFKATPTPLSIRIDAMDIILYHYEKIANRRENDPDL